MEKYPKGTSKQCSKTILNQMEKLIYIVNGRDIGFFINIIKDNKIIPCLITSYEVIDKIYIINNTSIEVKINEEIKTIGFGRNYYFDELNNITIIEIKENNENKINFSDLDEKIDKNDLENYYYDKKSIYTIYQGPNQNIYVSYGIINYLNNSEII